MCVTILHPRIHTVENSIPERCRFLKNRVSFLLCPLTVFQVPVRARFFRLYPLHFGRILPGPQFCPVRPGSGALSVPDPGPWSSRTIPSGPGAPRSSLICDTEDISILPVPYALHFSLLTRTRLTPQTFPHTLLQVFSKGFLRRWFIPLLRFYRTYLRE